MGGEQRPALSIDEVLDAIKPLTRSERICLDGSLIDEHARLEELLADEHRQDQVENRHAKAPEVAQQLEALEARIKAAEVEFVFAAIGDLAWSDLKDQPDNVASREDEEKGWDFNPKTFPAAAIVASCTSPTGLTLAKAQRLQQSLSGGQWQKLWGACLMANIGSADSPFSVAASVVLHGSERKSEQPGT